MVDDQDLFPIAAIPAAPVCRLYSTPTGMAGSPTVEARGRRSCGEERVMTTMAPETEQPAGAAWLLRSYAAR